MPGVAKSTAHETTVSLRNHPYTYFHLQLVSLPSHSRSLPSKPVAVAASASASSLSRASLDEITLRQYLLFALNQSFGLVGSAIGIDILKVEGRDAWIRIQSQDADVLNVALSQWRSVNQQVSLRVVGRAAAWLGGLSTVVTHGGEAKLWSLEQ